MKTRAGGVPGGVSNESETAPSFNSNAALSKPGNNCPLRMVRGSVSLITMLGMAKSCATFLGSVPAARALHSIRLGRRFLRGQPHSTFFCAHRLFSDHI